MSKTTNQQKIAVLRIWLEELKQKSRPRKRVVIDLDDE